MSDVIAKAPVRANKAAPKAKAAPLPPPAAPLAQDQHQDDGPTVDERLVAATLREQVMAIYGANHVDLHGDSAELLHAAAEELEKQDGGGYVTLYRAAAMLAGAIAVERAASPGGIWIATMDKVHKSLETASFLYDVTLEPGEAMAEGIRAGMRQQFAQPMSPLRRVKLGDSPYSEPQLRSVLSEIASVALSLDRVLLIAQNAQEDSDVTALIDTAEILVRQLGGMADGAIGGDVYGTQDKWTYGPNFADLGKAGAA